MPQGILNAYFLATPGGPTFFPTDIAGLIRWYDADSYTGSFTDGATITTPWLDNSTSFEDATPEPGNQPLFKDTVLAGGKSSVLFVNGFKHFNTTQMVLGNFSVVAFFRPNDFFGSADAIVAADPAGNFQVRTNGNPGGDFPSLFINGGNTLDAVGVNDATVWHVRTWNRTVATGVPLFYYNKIQEVEKDGQTRTTNMQIATVGLFDGGPGGFDLAEMLIYNTVLTQANVDNLYDGYFSLKYPGDL